VPFAQSCKLALCDCTALCDNVKPQRNVCLDAELRQNQSQMETNPKYRAMMQFRKKLPSYQMQQVKSAKFLWAISVCHLFHIICDMYC